MTRRIWNSAFNFDTFVLGYRDMSLTAFCFDTAGSILLSSYTENSTVCKKKVKTQEKKLMNRQLMKMVKSMKNKAISDVIYRRSAHNTPFDLISYPWHIDVIYGRSTHNTPFDSIS